MIVEPKARLDHRLTGLMVSQDMYKRINEISKDFNLSYGEIVRRGLSLFLSEYDNHIIRLDKNVREKE